MVRKDIRLWGPVTCGCRLHQLLLTDLDTGEQELQGFISPEEGQAVLDERMQDPRFASYTNPTLSEAIICDVHKGLGHTRERYEVVQKEADAVQAVMRAVYDTFPEAAELVTDKRGMEMEQLKKEITPEWSFNEKRELEVKLPDTLTKEESAMLTDALSSVEASITE